jgi:SAM-dependent methyltransferase
MRSERKHHAVTTPMDSKTKNDGRTSAGAVHAEGHYDAEYFSWQKEIGALAGESNAFMYSQYIRPADVVLDFGCGGGFLLAKLKCKTRYGVEINQYAQKVARGNGVTVFSRIEEMPEPADVVISSHALEHTLAPLSVLDDLNSVLKPGGLLVIVTPFDRETQWSPGDINQHLYTWSPMNLGNLVTVAKFEVLESKIIHHRFPPKGPKIRRILGANVFHRICISWGLLYRKVQQVRIVARKPELNPQSEKASAA